ncbi:MAG: Uma2 family endonuclease [Chloroflexota bacterium]
MIATPARLKIDDSIFARAKRFTVAEYHALIESGALTTENALELLEGLLVEKMPIYPPHRFTTDEIRKLLTKLLEGKYFVSGQQPITIDNSEPEPDGYIAKGSSRDYLDKHPSAEDLFSVIEVSDSTLKIDQTTKMQIYARAGIAFYWILNLVDRQIEVYSNPSGEVENPTYKQRVIYTAEDSVPVEIGGEIFGEIKVADILP